MEVNLGAIRFNWKGAYAGGTAYVADDVVSSGGSSYICILASTGNAVSNATYWSQMSAAGTDGTDLTSTLTTQGDVLYRDGSGLQRLAKGTAAQVLSVNSGATAPEWADAAAGGAWTFISSVTVSSAVANINFTGLSNTYHQYIVSIQSSNCSSSGERLNILTSSDNGSSYDNTSGDYRWHLMLSDSDAEAHDAFQSVNSTKLPIGYGTGSVSHISLSGTVRIHDPANTAMWTIVDSQVTALNYDGSTVHQGSLAGVRKEAAAVDAIRFYYDSGNIATGTFRLYGLANS